MGNRNTKGNDLSVPFLKYRNNLHRRFLLAQAMKAPQSPDNIG